MSDELNTFKDEVTESVNKLAQTPAIKSAFQAAAKALPIAGGIALGALFIAKSLPLALIAGAGYAGYKGVSAYLDADKNSGPSGPAPG